MTAYFVNVFAWAAFFVCWWIAGLFVNRTRYSDGRLRRLQYGVPMYAGFFLIFHNWSALHFFHGRLYDSDLVRWIGNIATIGGHLFAAWARFTLGRLWSGWITLKEGHRLVRSGPYRFARHPLYTGFLAATLGSVLVVATGDALVGGVLVFAAIFLKLKREESLLTKEFGDEYLQFKEEVSALVPFVY
jgi:protein-S-isoprenylcysteine O-methyltransferase Ste14